MKDREIWNYSLTLRLINFKKAVSMLLILQNSRLLGTVLCHLLLWLQGKNFAILKGSMMLKWIKFIKLQGNYKMQILFQEMNLLKKGRMW
jgi:hypothetical protein